MVNRSAEFIANSDRQDKNILDAYSLMPYPINHIGEDGKAFTGHQPVIYICWALAAFFLLAIILS